MNIALEKQIFQVEEETIAQIKVKMFNLAFAHKPYTQLYQ